MLYIDEVKPERIISLWNRSIGGRFPMTNELWQQNTVDDRSVMREASLAVVEGQELLGIIVAKRPEEHNEMAMQKMGWIQCLLVDENARNKGIGNRLLECAEEAFRKQGITDIRLGRDMRHYFPGVPAEDTSAIDWFTKRGYVCETVETDLIAHVKGWEPYELENGLQHFRLLTEKELPQLLEFLERSFPGRWHEEAKNYVLLNGTGREFIGLFENDQLQGFCRMNDGASPQIGPNTYWRKLVQGELGGIGPLGIDRSLRGRGFGLDIVKAGANELMKRGVNSIVIDWTQLVSFYEKLGFTPWKQYQTMSKQLESGGVHSGKSVEFPAERD
ncbi:GNAT family N-acetyltransferase [Sporosarcina cyprini]|uniref:GNAT family N-acetyltransferase n=1 Tax=Sporosarcina cyprini TaxID=2910523 RepID=UPI001EE0A233|nr:GNAT family N-acetyltransferase [Sporosarcina cyprini]MCG3088113.1 GNAT family N-acetyltransferase [Sporosarcina cyprini]